MKNPSESQPRPPEFTGLAWLMILNLIITTGSVILISVFGYAGFKGGEMGTMIGIFSVVGILFAIPVLILLIFVIRGLFRMGKWAVVFALVLTILGFLVSLSTLTAGIAPFLFALGYLLLTLFLEIRCLRYFSNKQRT
ncbi:MAG: hypothetical protein GXO83_04690 [Chlorobi bacterium]|nr:hypothetical protein [Chlorobiota bacterium]